MLFLNFYRFKKKLKKELLKLSLKIINIKSEIYYINILRLIKKLLQNVILLNILLIFY